MRRADARLGIGLGVALAWLGGCHQTVGTVLSPIAPTPAQEALAEGGAQAARGDVDRAIDAYRGATESHRDEVRTHLQYVRAMLGQGRRAELRRQYEERAARADATDAERTLAERLGTGGASSALRRVYTAAAERNPESPWWRLALVEVETAEADAWNRRRLAAIDRTDRVAEREAYLQSRGAMRRAQTALARSAEIAPDLAEVHLYRGHLRALEGDLQSTAAGREAGYRAAADAFVAATSRDPRLAEAWMGLGDVRYRLGQFRESLLAYLRAVRLLPADADLRLSLGVVLHEVGRLREATEQYGHAATLRTWDATPLLRLGDVRADAADWEGSLQAYRDALTRDPTAVEAHYRMGRVLEHLDRPGEARAAYQRYVDQGGPEAAAVGRRIERLLREGSR